MAEALVEIASLRQDLAKAQSLIRHMARKCKESEALAESAKERLLETKAELAEFEQYMHNDEDLV